MPGIPPTSETKFSRNGRESFEGEQIVSSVAWVILAWIFQNGPATVRRLIDVADYNFTTIKPVLDELVDRGFLRRDEKTRARAGNPIFYHITSDGAAIIVRNWNQLEVHEKVRIAHADNYSELGIFEEIAKASNASSSNAKRSDVSTVDELITIKIGEPEQAEFHSRDEATRLAQFAHLDTKTAAGILKVMSDISPEKRLVRSFFYHSILLAHLQVGDQIIAEINRADDYLEKKYAEMGFMSRIKDRISTALWFR